MPASPPWPRGATAVPSGRRGGGAPGRPDGFCSCMSSPGATGFRMPPGEPGLSGAEGRPPALLSLPLPPLLPGPSLRIGLPTSSRPPPERGWPGRPVLGRAPPRGDVGRCGAPGRCGVPGRCGAPGLWGIAGRWFWAEGATGRGLTPGRCPWGRAGVLAVGLLDWGRPTSSGLAGR